MLTGLQSQKEKTDAPPQIGQQTGEPEWIQTILVAQLDWHDISIGNWRRDSDSGSQSRPLEKYKGDYGRM